MQLQKIVIPGERSEVKGTQIAKFPRFEMFRSMLCFHHQTCANHLDPLNLAVPIRCRYGLRLAGDDSDFLTIRA